MLTTDGGNAYIEGAVADLYVSINYAAYNCIWWAQDWKYNMKKLFRRRRVMIAVPV